MSFRTKLTLLCIAVSMGGMQVTLAEIVQIDQSSTVTLSSLTQNVYDRHPALHNQLAQQQQMEANVDLANATFSNVKSITLTHQNDAIGSSDGLQEWEATVDMPLWLPGQKQQQRLLSDKMSAELPAYKDKVRLDASAKVRTLVWNVVVANNANKQADQLWQTAKKLEKDVAARVKAGELAGTQLLLASTNALEMHKQYLLTEAALEQALNSYSYITGEHSFPVAYEESLSKDIDRNQQHNASVRIAPQHPSLLLLDQRINTLRAQQNSARFDGAVNPSLSIGLRSERGLHGEDFNNSIGVGINFALDNDVYRRPAIANAAKELADAEILRLQLERELNIDLFSQLHDLETKQNQLQLVSEQNTITKQYYALQLRAFELGEIDLVNLLQSQSLANETLNRKQALELDIKRMIAMVNQSSGLVL
ncbi:TolC family protein [Pseudomonadota bacterium]|nr:TolC family protein [Pseudomonadota bacterium]